MADGFNVQCATCGRFQITGLQVSLLPENIRRNPDRAERLRAFIAREARAGHVALIDTGWDADEA